MIGDFVTFAPRVNFNGNGVIGGLKPLPAPRERPAHIKLITQRDQPPIITQQANSRDTDRSTWSHINDSLEGRASAARHGPKGLRRTAGS